MANEYLVDSCVRGYHYYQNICDPLIYRGSFTLPSTEGMKIRIIWMDGVFFMFKILEQLVCDIVTRLFTRGYTSDLVLHCQTLFAQALMDRRL